MRGKGAAPLRMMDRWSRISTTGVIGDPTQATAAKGQRVFDEAAAEDYREVSRPAYRASSRSPLNLREIALWL